MRVRSSKSSINRASNSTLRRIRPSDSRTGAGKSGCCSSATAVIKTGVNGVRSSWLSAAKKSSFARLAFSATSLSSRAFSCFFCSVKSATTRHITF